MPLPELSRAPLFEPEPGETGSGSFAIGSNDDCYSGLGASPVLAGSTAYAIADAFGWREGLDCKIGNADDSTRFFGALIISKKGDS